MDRSIAQALNSLMPSLTGSLPPELLELAMSLLAQSRSKASSLKADEEIARSYACANIACERLKQTLALPKIQPRPPCPPKVYQKLYKYLDGALPTGTRRSNRTATLNNQTSGPSASEAKPRTPTKAKHVRSDIAVRKTPQKRASTTADVPPWVMPVIRQLCKIMSAPAAPHHIYAGVSSIIISHGVNQIDEINIPALIIAVFLLVMTRLAGVKTQPNEYIRQKNGALQVLRDAAKGNDERVQVRDADVDRCTSLFKDKGWTQMDWFGNVPVGAGIGNVNGSEDVADDGASGIEEAEEQLLPLQRKIGRMDPVVSDYLQAGLGTMMRDQVDYLSDDRRRSYQEWKKGILIRIDELEKNDAMDHGVN